MSPEQLAELKDNEHLRKRLAKPVALKCFRNTQLENLDTGRFPSSIVGDYSDVKVVSPLGEISWPKLSRLSDPEMREHMIDVVDHCYDFLMELCSSHGAEIIDNLMRRDELPGWNGPEMRIFGS